jgi:surfeit locus 1 family protein
MKILRMMVSRKWILTTLLVFAGTALCVRLGIWQLDRLSQRRAFNAHYLSVRAQKPLDINQSLGQDLAGMEYRDAIARGRYDFELQVALRNQYNGDQYGYHLLTPLVVQDGVAILVDRGWVPAGAGDTPDNWRQFDQAPDAQVAGILRLGRARAELGGVPDPTLAPGQPRLDTWNAVNIDRIQGQVPYRLLPVYLQPAPQAGDSTPPIPYQPVIEISEGPHLGYAGQWFTFAALLFFGYPIFYLPKQVKHEIHT